MTKYKYNYRDTYREMLQEEASIRENTAAPTGAMSASGTNSVTGDSGSGVSSDQGSYGPSDARNFNGFVFSVSRKKMEEMLNGSCKKENVNESCENCNCENCKPQKKEETLVEKCMNHFKEFFGESFEIEEYMDESATEEQLKETILVSIKKAGQDDQQASAPTSTDQQTQTPSSSVCQTCNTDPCKCQKEPAQGSGDPNLQGQQVIVQKK